MSHILRICSLSKGSDEPFAFVLLSIFENVSHGVVDKRWMSFLHDVIKVYHGGHIVQSILMCHMISIMCPISIH